MPESVTSIGGYVFWDCGSLASITIPEGVTSIGEYAFAHCQGLTSITIPEKVTSIDDAVFYNCRNLASVYCKPTTAPTLGGPNVLAGNASGRTIYVPTASVDAYKAATEWSTYADAIVGYDFSATE